MMSIKQKSLMSLHRESFKESMKPYAHTVVQFGRSIKLQSEPYKIGTVNQKISSMHWITRRVFSLHNCLVLFRFLTNVYIHIVIRFHTVCVSYCKFHYFFKSRIKKSILKFIEIIINPIFGEFCTNNKILSKRLITIKNGKFMSWFVLAKRILHSPKDWNLIQWFTASLYSGLPDDIRPLISLFPISWYLWSLFPISWYIFIYMWHVRCHWNSQMVVPISQKYRWYEWYEYISFSINKEISSIANN